MNAADAVYHSALRFITGSIYKKCMFLINQRKCTLINISV